MTNSTTSFYQAEHGLLQAEVNPLMVMPEGEGILAVKALVPQAVSSKSSLKNSVSDRELLDGLSASALHHRLPVAGTVVHWREWGQGEPLVLLHGGHGSWMHWARNIGSLAQHYRVLAPDMPGFGDSEDFSLPPHDPQRLDALQEALTLSVEQLAAGQQVNLAGFSFGGAMAGLLAAHCNQVKRLALLGPGGHGGARRQTVPLSDWRIDDAEARAQALRQNLAAFMLSGDEAVDALAEHIHATSCEATRFRSKPISRRAILQEALQGYDRPMLLVWGEADVTAMPMEMTETLVQQRPERDWIIIPRAGHWVQYESADMVNTKLLRWLQG